MKSKQNKKNKKNMAGVSTNTSYTANTRVALKTNMQEASRSAIAMSTGNAISHAYEDPTGLAIGSSMKAAFDVLSIVKTGIEQSQSMLYIAEEGLKSAYSITTQMNQILAKAKLGYMTDELIQSTLSPTYQQLKQEMNRIADAVQFNGQNLLNGTGGTKTAGTAATWTQAATKVYQFNQGHTSTIGNLASGTITGVGASFALQGKVNGTLEDFTLAFAGKTQTVTGGTFSDTATGFKITGATVRITGAVTSTSITTAGDLSFTADINVTTNETPANGVLTLGAADTIGLSNIAGYSVAATGKAITEVSIKTKPTTLPAPFGATGLTVSNVDTAQSNSLTGGQGATSSFDFVTGTNLSGDVITVPFPNIKLIDSPAVKGVVSTLNIDGGFKGAAAPTDLTNLQGADDADIDIPLVKALADKMIVFLDDIGAYEKRFINLDNQLTTAVEQLDLAQGAILNADLSAEVENFTRANVKVTVAIAMLNNLNNTLRSLERLVS